MATTTTIERADTHALNLCDAARDLEAAGRLEEACQLYELAVELFRAAGSLYAASRCRQHAERLDTRILDAAQRPAQAV